MILKLTPILLMTLATIIVSFSKIKKKNKALVMITTFVLWMAVAGITWFSLFK